MVNGVLRLPGCSDLFDGTVYDYKAGTRVVACYRLHMPHVVRITGADPPQSGRVFIRQRLRVVVTIVGCRVLRFFRPDVEHSLESREIQRDLSLLCYLGALLVDEDLRMPVQVVGESCGPALVATTNEKEPWLCWGFVLWHEGHPDSTSRLFRFPVDIDSSLRSLARISRDPLTHLCILGRLRPFELVAEVLDILLEPLSYDHLSVQGVERTVMPVIGGILAWDCL